MIDPVPQDDPDLFEGIPATAALQSIGERFAAVADRWPDRVAIDTGTERSTYAALATGVECVARHVAALAGSEPMRVGCVFERPLSLLPAIFGVLRAGAVYVPIDPGFPAARIATVLDDAEVGLILCDDRTHSFARGFAAASRPVMNVDALEPTADDSVLPPAPAASAIASIFYTSGSSGTPKGVIQNHRNLIHYARCYVDTLGMRPADRVSLLFSCAFSASIPDLFGALLCGATLCPFDMKRGGPTELARWLGEHEISLLHLVPSLFRHLVDRVPVGAAFPALRAIDLGGEAVTAPDVASFRRVFGSDPVLIHRLAATEASLISRYTVDSGKAVADGVLPVGRPVEAMQIRITDPNGESVETQGVGEIVLRSRYLSPGYWRRPELTNAAFCDDPEEPGVRFFRTGDRGRRRADGIVEHLGRGDQRVKLRGFTVEIAEVEAALRADPRVRECAVVAQPGPGRDVLLAAFVRTLPDEKFAESEMRRSLRRTLPEYAIPVRLRRMAELPMTATGKVDRRRLERGEVPAALDEKEFVAPRNAIETNLASIWCSELGLGNVGVYDDYFALGGTSLQAVQVMARIEEQFGRDLPPSLLLDAPTIAELGDRIERDQFPDPGSLAVALKPDGSRRPLFCFPGIGGEPIIFKAFVRHLGADQPCYGVQTPALVGAERPTRNVADYVGPQIEAIRAVQPTGPYFFAGYSFGSTLAFETARLLAAEGEKIALLALIDGSAPGHPWLRSDAPALHQALDRWFGSRLKESQRGSPGKIVVEALKMRARDLDCRLRELAGRPLTRVQRRRRHKRSAVRARNRYQPTTIDTPLWLIRSESASNDAIFDRDPLRGWSAWTTHSIEVREAPGSHDELLDEPNVVAVAAAVSEALARARTGGDRGESVNFPSP